MDKQDLQEARTNPEFLDYLEKTRVDAIATKNISALYEVLDSFLVLDLDEEKVNEIYQHILQVAFENVQKIVDSNRKLKLEGDDLFYVRAFYEHAVEKWSYQSYDGAKELIFVLSNIIEDEFLVKALQSHIIAISNNKDLNSFYENEVDLNSVDIVESHAYFITSFNYDLDEYLNNNKEILAREYENLKHLID